ncbi:MAG TPA: enoyl-CoA hydratase-related protein, partial [Gemmatimonadales bacterium]|nr:enoyl-CoA hydratase-related protein [Gemmatimonadales bacterium]
MPTTLLFELRDGIARVTIDRPDKLNALNATVISELGDAVTRIETDPAVRGVILTGAGPKAFVAGADITELAEQSPIEGKNRSLLGQSVFRRLERCGKPVIAAVNGFALGGGCELAMACHIRIAAEHARFGQPEVKLGIGPGYGGTVRLPRLVGRARALELLLTGAMIDAAEAERRGLANRVVPPENLLDEAKRLGFELAQKPPISLRLAKEAVTKAFESTIEVGLELERRSF